MASDSRPGGSRSSAELDVAGSGIVQVADGVHWVPGTHTNWVLVTEGDAVTLVDAGYPGDLPRVEASLAAIGRSVADVAAIVLTHAHVDHIGDAARLRRTYGTRVMVWSPEAPLARGEVREMISRPHLMQMMLTVPGAVPALMRTSRVMGPKTMLLWRNVPVPDPEVFEADGPLDVPGGLVPVPTPGHTSGHCSYHLPGRGALISGDTLITGFPVDLDPPQPQMMHPYFAQDYEKVVQSTRRLADLEADVVVPGHGRPYYGSPAAAVAGALAAAGR